MASIFTSLAAMVTAFLNWGLGLIVGAILAREMGRSARERGFALHYPLVVAAGYTGLMVWHGGLSGSAPLSVATPGHPLEGSMGLIPISETLFSPLNLILTVFLLAAVPVLLALMAPRSGEPTENSAPDAERHPVMPDAPRTSARRLEDSRLLAGCLAAGLAVYLGRTLVEHGGHAVNLNTLNLAFLIAGLALHGTPRRYAEAVEDAARGTGGILLQFPFYSPD